MIEDIERGKEDIREYLVSARQNPKKRAHELVELLEDKTILDKLLGDEEISKDIKPKHNRKHSFYRAYIVYLFNNFIFDDDDVEIMLVAFNYHPDFEHETRAKYRRDLYARQVYELKHRKGWGDSVEDKDAGLRGEEARIMDELSEVLAELAVKEDGTLKLVEEVLATLELPDAKDEAGLPPEDDPATTGGEQDSRSKKTVQPDTPDPPSNPQGFRIHIGSLSIGPLININKKFRINASLSWVKNPFFFILLLIAIITVATVVGTSSFHPPASPESEFPSAEETSPPVEEIFPSEKEVVLVPGEKCPLKVAVLPVEAGNETLSFVSSDPNIVTVSRTGVLSACDNPETRGQPYEKVKITIQAESGATTTKTVVVNFAGVDPPRINKEIEAGFYIWHQIRLVGTREWSTTVDAEIGDIVEIQIQYRNISEGDQRNVQIRDVLPPSLRYVAGTTKLWNSNYNGAVNNEDTIATTGINIGHYDPNANAYIRFRAEVVESGLADGMNTLMNWAQAGVGDVTLQEASAVYVNKGE